MSANCALRKSAGICIEQAAIGGRAGGSVSLLVTLLFGGLSLGGGGGRALATSP